MNLGFYYFLGLGPVSINTLNPTAVAREPELGKEAGLERGAADDGYASVFRI